MQTENNKETPPLYKEQSKQCWMITLLISIAFVAGLAIATIFAANSLRDKLQEGGRHGVKLLPTRQLSFRVYRFNLVDN